VARNARAMEETMLSGFVDSGGRIPQGRVTDNKKGRIQEGIASLSD